MGWRTKGSQWAQLKRVAGEMRSVQTGAERCLWERLRQDRLGVRFRRQFVIDRFIVDLFCQEAGLVVEVDGGVHLARSERDADRDRRLGRRGLRVLRFDNEDVMANTDSVVARIQAALQHA